MRQREPGAAAPLLDDGQAGTFERGQAGPRTVGQVFDRQWMTDRKPFDQGGLGGVEVLQPGADQFVQGRRAERLAEQLPDPVVFLQLVILHRADDELSQKQRVASGALVEHDRRSMGNPSAQHRTEKGLDLGDSQRNDLDNQRGIVGPHRDEGVGQRFPGRHRCDEPHDIGGDELDDHGHREGVEQAEVVDHHDDPVAVRQAIDRLAHEIEDGQGVAHDDVDGVAAGRDGGDQCTKRSGAEHRARGDPDDRPAVDR